VQYRLYDLYHHLNTPNGTCNRAAEKGKQAKTGIPNILCWEYQYYKISLKLSHQTQDIEPFSQH